MGDAYGSGYAGRKRFQVELTFSQRFRQLADGVTFEQVFTGYARGSRDPHEHGASSRTVPRPPAPWAWRCAATRGRGVTPAQAPAAHYFRSSLCSSPTPASQGAAAAKWNIQPGMKPIRWLISPW